MALVGDVIVSAREIVPDPCGLLPTPSLANFPLSVVAASGSTLPAATYLCKVTLLTPWGETAPTAESGNQVVGSNQGIQIGGTLPAGATKARLYFGVGTGNENQFVEVSTLPATISTPGTGGIPPTNNRAYLPDSDGSFASAATLFRWLNEGLDIASRVSGGILDATGVGTVNGQPLYQLVNQWMKITKVWFDGYEVSSGDKSQLFYRNAITSYVGMRVDITLAPNTILECYPQPNRTSGQATTSTLLSGVGTSVTLNAPNPSFVLPLGLALIGNEIVSYQSLSSNVLSGLTRGLGGTTPGQWVIGTAVTELNLRISGYRMATKYTPGQSSQLMRIPPGWETLLPIYLESHYREAEHEWRVAQDLRKEFEEGMKRLQSGMKVLSAPRQVGDNVGVDAYGVGLGGGWLIR